MENNQQQQQTPIKGVKQKKRLAERIELKRAKAEWKAAQRKA